MPYTPPAHAPFSVGSTCDNSDMNAINTGVVNAYTQLESITANDGITLPSSDGPFTLANFISYLSKVIRNITGATNWYDVPAATLSGLNTNKLDSSAYTAADVLTKIKTVDGVGSGLDADLLDGLSSASYAQLGSAANFTSTLQKSGKDVVFAQVGLTGKWSAQGSAPSSPADGDLWLDTSVVL